MVNCCTIKSGDFALKLFVVKHIRTLVTLVYFVRILSFLSRLMYFTLKVVNVSTLIIPYSVRNLGWTRQILDLLGVDIAILTFADADIKYYIGSVADMDMVISILYERTIDVNDIFIHYLIIYILLIDIKTGVYVLD